MRWVWLSFSPGITRRPPASMLRVSVPAIGPMSRPLPTAKMLPSRIATASASGFDRSSVVTLALRSTVSGAGAISASRGLSGCQAFAGDLLVLLAAEHGLGVGDAQAIGTAQLF